MKLHYIKYDLKHGIQKIKTKTAFALSAAVLTLGGGTGLTLATFGSAHALTGGVVVYDSTPSVTPATNYPSQPFQAQQTNEFGDYVHLSGTARQLNTVTLTMSNWALAATPANVAYCEANAGVCDDTGFNWPITTNIYANTLTGDVPNHLLGSKEVTVHVPWRPVGPACTSGDTTGWQDSAGHCNHGLAFNAPLDLSSLNLTLPTDVIVGFVYNTQTYGLHPTHVDGPYNSLNIAVPDNQVVSVGTDDSSDSTFWNTSTTTGYYTNPNCTGNTFCRDTNWTPNGTVAMQITANQAMPKTADQCKNNGWKSYGSTFKNQGDCVSFIATQGKNQPSGH